jgi:AcrR family transcriptional regulator
MDSENEKNKRERILVAALRLFNKEGFEKTATAKISKEAGVATGLLFHYFPSKEELIGAVYLHCKDSMMEAMLKGFDRSAPFEEMLRSVYRNYLSWAFSPGGEFLFFQQFSDSSYIGERTRESGHERCAPLFEFLAEGIRLGKIRDLGSDYLFELLASMLASTARYLIANPRSRGDEAFMEKSFRMIRDCVLVQDLRL